MKVIFINRYFFPDHSATSQLLSDLGFALSEQGVSTTVVTSRQLYGDSEAKLPRKEVINGVNVLRLWTTRFGRGRLFGRAMDYITFYFSTLLVLLREVDKGDIVVAKTDPPLISVVACFAANIKGAGLINWVQDLFPEVAVELGVGVLKGRLGRVLRRMRNHSLNAARMNVVLGEQMRSRLIREGVSAEKISIIHNWSDDSAIHPIDRDANSLRKKWGLSDRFVVGYSGNMGRAHEFDVVLDAAEKLQSRKNIVFVLIGDGAKRSWIESQIDARKIGNVMLKPYQPRSQLAESLSVPDVHFVSLKPELEGLIVPSKYYGIAAAGRPAIFSGSTEGEVARLILAADSGFVVQPGDSESLAATIESLSVAGELCDRMGANARMAFDRNYGMEKSMKGWCDILGFGRSP